MHVYFAAPGARQGARDVVGQALDGVRTFTRMSEIAQRQCARDFVGV
jgi:hypothetical protein